MRAIFSSRRPSPAMVVALVALVSSLVGGATAATVITGKQIAKNAIGPKHVKKNAVKPRHVRKKAIRPRHVRKRAIRPRHVRKNAIRGGHVKLGSLLAEHFQPGELVAGAPGPEGPMGMQGPKGDTGPSGPPGPSSVASDHALMTDSQPLGDALVAFNHVFVDVPDDSNRVIAQASIEVENGAASTSTIECGMIIDSSMPVTFSEAIGPGEARTLTVTGAKDARSGTNMVSAACSGPSGNALSLNSAVTTAVAVP